MKNFYLTKKTSIITFIISLAISLGYFFIMLTNNQSFSIEIIIGVIKPVAVAGIAMTIIAFFFLFFPESIFKSWLKKIAWWYGLGLFLITANTSIYSSNILSLDRSQIVFGGMILLAIITVPFVVVAKRKLIAFSR